MKTFTMLFFFMLFVYPLIAQVDSLDMLHNSEVLFYNDATTPNLYSIRVKIYPVSMVFNGWYGYNLNAKYPLEPPSSIQYNFINGRNADPYGYYFDILPGGSFVGFNHDKDENNTAVYASVGFGKYKAEIRKLPNLELLDTCTIEFDAGYPGIGLSADVEIHFRNDNNGIGGSGDRLTYKWSGCTEQNITAVNKKIEAWNQCSSQTRLKRYDEMIYNSANGNNRILLPQDFRQDCPNENYPNFTGQYGTGLLTLNLTIDKDVRTRLYIYENERYEVPTQIVISSNCTLRVNPGWEFEIKEDIYYSNNQNYFTKLFLKPFSVVKLEQGNGQNDLTKMVVEKNNWLILECNSKILLSQYSLLELQTGSKLCMRGGTVSGGLFIITGYVPRLQCLVPCAEDNIFEDSANLYIDTNSILELEDSTVFVFKGNQTTLTCKENSTIKFGKGSKLVFQDGARINANGCKFVSYDSTEVWDGIYLDGIAYDTLKNCTFQNAVNGINITDNYDPLGSPGAVEISNCSFKNLTSSDLLNYVYVNNSYNVLIKGCNSEKTGSGGFTSGIIAEYCPTNGVVIADNNINYVTTGISLLQSSEYIGRNTITGSTNSGTGIYLDNSNGTIEYNTVNIFQKSVYGSYSSPYMLKNTLSNAYVKNIDLASNSYPVMKPVVSGSTLRWLGGNNTITGTPSNSGIAFADCYPLMDSGSL